MFCLFQFKQRAQYEKEAADLRQQIQNLTSKYDSVQLEVNMKEDRIQQLLQEVQNLVCKIITKHFFELSIRIA